MDEKKKCGKEENAGEGEYMVDLVEMFSLTLTYIDLSFFPFVIRGG